MQEIGEKVPFPPRCGLRWVQCTGWSRVSEMGAGGGYIDKGAGKKR